MINRFFVVAGFALIAAGAVFLGNSILGESNDTTPLAIALGCILLSNLLNTISQLGTKKYDKRD